MWCTRDALGKARETLINARECTKEVLECALNEARYKGKSARTRQLLAEDSDGLNTGARLSGPCAHSSGLCGGIRLFSVSWAVCVGLSCNFVLGFLMCARLYKRVLDHP